MSEGKGKRKRPAKKSSGHVRINRISSEGLLILSASMQKNNVAKLFVTDFTNIARILIDVEKEKWLHGSVTISEHDVKVICKELKNEKLSFLDKVKNAIVME